MVIGLAGGNDAKFAGSPYPGKPLGEHGGGPHQPIVALDGKALVDADTLWSCTTCRACVEECPMMIEHVDAIVDMRRHLTTEKGATPNKGAEVLDNLIATDNPGGFAPGGRLNWAADLNLPLMSEKKSADVLFWVGDGAFDMRNQRTLRAFVKILKAAAVDFAVLGLEERDSGDVARRLGDEATFQNLARRNIATLAKYRFTRIVSCDPHSFHVLKNEYGALGGDYQYCTTAPSSTNCCAPARCNRAAARPAASPTTTPATWAATTASTRRRATCCAHSASRSRKCNAPASARAVAAAVAARRSPTSPASNGFPTCAWPTSARPAPSWWPSAARSAPRCSKA